MDIFKLVGMVFLLALYSYFLFEDSQPASNEDLKQLITDCSPARQKVKQLLDEGKVITNMDLSDISSLCDGVEKQRKVL